VVKQGLSTPAPVLNVVGLMLVCTQILWFGVRQGTLPNPNITSGALPRSAQAVLLRCHAAVLHQGGSAGAVRMLAAFKPSQLLAYKYEAAHNRMSQILLWFNCYWALFDRMQR
jgi:hypothetical protein